MRRLLLLCTTLFVLLAPSAAHAAGADIGTPGTGSLTSVHIEDDLRCQVKHVADGANGSFYPAGGTPARCATAIAVDGQLYGALSFTSVTHTPFTPVTQGSVSGAGTEADPREVVTRVQAGATGIQVEQTDSYVNGEESHETQVRVINASGSTKSVRIYKLADCYIAGSSDSGFGFLDRQTGSVGCSKTPHNDPPDRVLGFMPLSDVGGSFAFEGQHSDVYTKVAAGPLPNTCACTGNQNGDPIDNGMALGWTVSVPDGDSAQRSLITFFSPNGTIPDNAAPRGLTIDAPANGSATRDARPLFAGEAGNNVGDLPQVYMHVFKGTEADFETYAGLVSGFTAEADPATGRWAMVLPDHEAALPDGVYTAAAAQSDRANNYGFSPPVVFEVDTKAPAPTVTAPAAGSTVGQRPLFAGTAGNTPGDHGSVGLTLKGPDGTERSIGGAVKNDGGRWLYQPDTDLAPGAYALRVTQHDHVGNTATSAPVAFTVEAGGQQFTGELPPAGTPAIERSAIKVTKVKRTRTRKRMPNIVGLRIDKARDKLAKAGINMDLDIRESAGSSSRFRIGQVMRQSPRRGAVVVSDADSRRKIRVTVFQGTRPGKKKCPSAAQLNKALKGMDLDVALRILKADGCEVVIKIEQKKTGDAPEVGKVKSGGSGGGVQVVVQVPTRPSGQDLFLLVRSITGHHQFKGMNVTDWSLPVSSQRNAVSVQVIDRAGRFVENANVHLAGAGADTSMTTGRTGERREASIVPVQTYQAGTLRILATATGRDGQSLFGYAQIRVRDMGSNTEWATTDGRTFLRDICRVGPRNASTAQLCVTNWRGNQVIPIETGRTTINGIGPEVDGDSEAAFGRLGGPLVSALNFDGAVGRLWGSNRLSAVNKMRAMVDAQGFGYYPAQLVVQGATPINGSPVGASYQNGSLNRINGARKEAASGPQLLASSGNVVAGVKTGMYSVANGQGRVSDAARSTIDASRANVVTFPDGTSVFDDGTANPPWAAGRQGVVGLYP